MVDIETSQVVDMLESRKTEDVAEWLKKYPEIEIVSRDGALSYENAITSSLPDAAQVSDRFHLLKNLTDYCKDFIKRSIPNIIKLKNDSIFTSENKIEELNQNIVSVSEPKQICNQNNKNKNKIIEETKELYRQSFSISHISRELKLDRKTVAKYIAFDGEYVHGAQGMKHSNNLLDKYKNTIIEMKNNHKKYNEIYETIVKNGYGGSYSTLRHFLSNIKKGKNIQLEKYDSFSRQVLISLLYKDKSKLKNVNIQHIDKYLESNQDLLNLYDLLKEFREIFVKKTETALNEWIDKCKKLNLLEINSFVNGIERDISAVKNAVKLKYSNGLAEGTVNKIKVIKRIMYGKASFELLRQKVLLW